jgi:hypothetical protein
MRKDYNRSVPVFMCRWPNGDLSFVAAASKDDAIVMLDELDNADLAEVKQIQDFMIDFRLTDSGELEFQGFGERCTENIWERAYPVLSRAVWSAPTNAAGEPSSPSQELVLKAVAAERQRLTGKNKRKAPDTETGKAVQSQMGAPTVLVNRLVKQAATEVLKRSPNTGRKQ